MRITTPSEVARQAQPLSLRDGILTIGVASSPWLHQLTLVADELRGRLNRAHVADGSPAHWQLDSRQKADR